MIDGGGSGAATIPDALAEAVARWPDGEAFVGPGGRVTWRQLGAEVDRTAAGLAAAGVMPGDHVGLLMGNGLDWVRSFYALARLRAVTVPLSTRFKPAELAFCLGQARITTVVCVERLLGIDLPGLIADGVALVPDRPAPRVLVLDRAWPGPMPGAVPTSAARPSETALIQYTSGTTAFPKGVMLTHAAMVGNARGAARRIGVQPDDRYLSVRPYYHVAGTTLSLLVSVVSGCCLLTVERFEPGAVLALLADERCTLTSGNDTIFLMLLGHPDLDAGRLHLRGGWAAAGPEVMAQIVEVLGATGMCNAYGLSEAAPNVAMSWAHDPLALRVEGWLPPQDGVEVRIVETEGVDPGDQVLGPGHTGEIQVRGTSVMQGYFDQPEATAAVLDAEGWLRTGDLGVLDAEGRLRMVGRLKDVFRVGGENVAPAEVEEVLHAHPAVAVAQVVGVPDPRLGEVPAAYVVLRTDVANGSVGEDELVEWCRARVAGFRVPRYVRVVDTFDGIGMTGSSKVQKARLREHALVELGLDR